VDARIPPGRVKLKRVYARAAHADGTRILVDRQWPGGVKAGDAAIDRWEKDLAPSRSLHQWFDHDPARWEVFRYCYEGELREHRREIEHLRALARQGPITLVFAARDETHSNAIVLRDVLLGLTRTREPLEAMRPGRHAGDKTVYPVCDIARELKNDSEVQRACLEDTVVLAVAFAH
jgi:uncharacterized protein YeaO (DUF488 family)